MNTFFLTLILMQPVFPTNDPLVLEGARLFFEETFDGNGRTCGTCHPADNNLTIDPEFIATLPDNDPLFVAEFVPELLENFEKPKLMRRFGLIVENTNGFDDLENNFTMRGVPHVFAQGVSITPSNGSDTTTVPPVHRTGWSGDGSPRNGSLRAFSVGAVRQHFTKTLRRRRGVDFRVPTQQELRAMEAFMLFLGRDEDPDLTTMRFKDPVVARGLEIFLTPDTVGGTLVAGKCNRCHFNAGATAAFELGANVNFNTGVEDIPDQPADLLAPQDNPPDDGFGNPGDGTFNTPSIIEAADTGPFFHNNSVETIEGAVDFYTSDAFTNSPIGQALVEVPGEPAIDLEATHVVAIAAFLRVINAVENIRASTEVLEFALTTSTRKKAFIRSARPDIEDAVEVLDGGNLHPLAQRRLKNALRRLERALEQSNLALADEFTVRAIDAMASARRNMVRN